MAKGKRKPPSRKRYDEENPTKSCRLTREEKRCLDEHLKEAGCSFAHFVRSRLREEKSMIEERVDMLAKRKAPPSFEERLKCIEDLTYQAVLHCYNYNQEDRPQCPHCHNRELLLAFGNEMGFTDKGYNIPVLKCPQCGYYPDTYKRMDPKTIEWPDPGAAKSAMKPKSPPGKKKH